MALFPLVCNFEGDFVLKLLPVDTEQTMAEVGQAAAVNAVGIHVADQPGKTIYARKEGADSPFPLDMKLSDSGLEPMDCVKFYFV
ncbi:toluene-4-monooxygenase system B family protein [Rhodopseudomonas palustris]|uniref:toluene-4-monooxygenase system B family protein n=1 Tax=Rhodopseudomonas palustris TaxID=1076 RepID=UPI002ACE1809|nr:toluene-4-monooxygenase system B family protein [Rhodopseudomonas palustris]WQG97852.1 toluene-4-monooxygenase system B family protein [Rhodopseudomonas palustris]